jgi:hypothetical protein
MKNRAFMKKALVAAVLCAALSAFMGCDDGSKDPERETYTVTYNANSGIGTAPSSQTVNAGSSVTVEGQGYLSYTGKTFTGWNTNYSGTGTPYSAGSYITVSGNVNLYAQWTDDLSQVPSNLSLDDTLTWISANAVEGGDYAITLKTNETIDPKTLDYGGKNIGVTIGGGTSERRVNLNATGSLSTVESGVTLTLGANVLLQGRSQSNTASLITVNSNGTLVMNDGAKIRGNFSTSSSVYGGGVTVDMGGAFTMNGGEINGGNSAARGGGVYVDGGAFTMHDGEISGNTSTSSGNGGGVYINGGTFTMNGGDIYYNATDKGGGVIIREDGTFTMNGGVIYSNAASSGGGVLVGTSGTFTKQMGAIIDGSDASDTLKNIATDGNSYGHAVHVLISSSSSRKRNTTAGPNVTLNSARSGSAGGWE